MSKQIIVMISEGRSGTNGVYRYIFANSKKKIEPFKDTLTKDQRRFKQALLDRSEEFENKVIIHIKPQHTFSNGKFKKLTIEQMIDSCIECGIYNFIVIKRLNTLAKIISSTQCYLQLTTLQKVKHKVDVKTDQLKERLRKGSKYEDEVIAYLKGKEDEGVKMVEVIYEDDIKDDVKVACKKIVDVFTWLPNDYVDYDEDMKKQKKLSVFDRNNNMFDRRPIHQRVSNLEATTKALQKYDALWMLEIE